MTDLKVDLGGLKMSTPVTTASGTFGYGTEYADLLDYSKLGAVTVKGVRKDPWPGNQMTRHCEVPGGMVNAIGLQGPGVVSFIENYIDHYCDIVKSSLERRGAAGASVPPMIVNIWGGSVEEYAEVAKCLSDCEYANGDNAVIGAIECNVSCPNVKEGGHTFGQDPAVLGRLVKAVRESTELPLIVKLAPNVPDLRPYTQACEDNGADALALINTIPAMVIDIEKRVPVLANRTGGLSGRGIHPAAVKLVYDAHRATKLPILAMGGIYEAKDAIEFLLAGATAVAVGTAIFTNPGIVTEVYEGIVDYCDRHGFSSLSECVMEL
jgi:dihydroorotate dehydrogenase (NAD+) catalytic subunit